MIAFIRAADEDAATKQRTGHGLQQAGGGPRSVLLEHHPPAKLEKLFSVPLPDHGQGHSGVMDVVQRVLQYSVNTWDQGFLDKLYASTTPVGLAADLVLSALNTNVHVYQVSPALTVVEKQTARALARMFGFDGPAAGGVSQPGGSAANQSSMVIARNNLFPETKVDGNGGRRFVLFTSKHGHYSVEKAAQMFGFGSRAVKTVDVDKGGCMRPDVLERAIEEAKAKGETPFYVNATAGTTVLGSFDPLEPIADVCRRHQLWMHVDGSWGGSVVFSEKHRYKLKGIEKADSIAMCPHKMLSVPVTCSFLLGRDLRQFHKAMTLPANYLFHDNDEAENGLDSTPVDGHALNVDVRGDGETKEYWDLADLTPQCGRRGDSLKLAFSWIYYGTTGLESQVDHAFDIAAHLASSITSNPRFTMVSENPPPCLQLCFYFDKQQTGSECAERNSRTTKEITKALIPRGFMTDYAPGDDGYFFRVVVNAHTKKDTVEALLTSIEEIGGAMKLR